MATMRLVLCANVALSRIFLLFFELCATVAPVKLSEETISEVMKYVRSHAKGDSCARAKASDNAKAGWTRDKKKKRIAAMRRKRKLRISTERNGEEKS